MSALGDVRGVGVAQSELRFYPGISAGNLSAGVPLAGVPSIGVPSAGVPSAGVPSTGVPSAGRASPADPGDRQSGFESRHEEWPAHEEHAAEQQRVHERRASERSAHEQNVRERSAHASSAHQQGPNAAHARHRAESAEQRSKAEPRPKAERSVAELIDADLLDELESQLGADFGTPRSNNPLGRLPMASLEQPSMARLDLTPSPVPRVSLVPATGSLDISLVPGPNSLGSRNLPTLAARHAVARAKPRRRAPAVTLPPPGAIARDARGSGQLTKDVQSSKREIALGLTIGIGLSVLLAVVGQAYLGGEQPVAGSPSLATEAMALGAGSPGAPAPAANAPAPAPTAAARTADAPPRPASSVADERKAVSGADEAEDVSKASAAPRRAGSARKERALRAKKANATRSDFSEAEAGKSFDGPSPEKTPLSPSESAGLGLDLPL